MPPIHNRYKYAGVLIYSCSLIFVGEQSIEECMGVRPPTRNVTIS